ncbi:MAG: hypothetical protein SXQ77_02405, partial [Halobacteria archaeon]|nr:hypothetical protein [Halobacteria archaeon]
DLKPCYSEQRSEFEECLEKVNSMTATVPEGVSIESGDGDVELELSTVEKPNRSDVNRSSMSITQREKSVESGQTQVSKTVDEGKGETSGGIGGLFDRILTGVDGLLDELSKFV